MKTINDIKCYYDNYDNINENNNSTEIMIRAIIMIMTILWTAAV